MLCSTDVVRSWMKAYFGQQEKSWMFSYHREIPYCLKYVDELLKKLHYYFELWHAHCTGDSDHDVRLNSLERYDEPPDFTEFARLHGREGRVAEAIAELRSFNPVY